MPETVTVGELLVRIRADVRDLEAGIQKTQLGVATMATRTRPGLRQLENGFRMLAFQAAGVPGPLGRIAATLLHMSAGGIVTLGVVAGLGLIAMAWKKITEKAREAEQAQKKAVQAALETPLAQAQKNLALAQQALTRFQLEREDLEAQRAWWQPDVFAEKMAKVVVHITQARRAVESWENAVFEASSATQQWGADILAAAGYVDQNLGDQLEQILPRLQRFWEVFGMPRPQVITPRAEEFRGRLARLLPLLPLFGGQIEQLEDQFRRNIQRALERGVKIPEVKTSALTVGFTLGEYISQGIRAGMDRNLGEYLKMVLKDAFARLMSGAIFAGIGALIAGPPGAAVGFTAGSGIPISLKAPMTPGTGISTLDLSRMPAANNPLAAARDAQWQIFLKESLLVGRSLGFRGA